MVDIPQLNHLSPKERALLFQKLRQRRDRQAPRQGIPVLPRTPGRLFPLSFTQERMWFYDQLDPNTGVNNASVAFRLTGAFDSQALQNTLEDITRRHEALRTVFVIENGQPHQVIRPSMTLPVSTIDLTALLPGEQEREIRQILAAEARHSFDLANGPLMHVRLLQVAEQEQIFIITVHHIIADGWSSMILTRELVALYQAFANGETLTFPTPPVQYADYATWQRQTLQGDVLEKHLSFWKEQLAGCPPVLELPTDKPRRAGLSNAAARQKFFFPKLLGDQLKRLAQQERATLFMVMLAAFNTLLYRYTGQEDMLVGTLVANRMQPQLKNILGCFINSLPLRTSLAGNPSFRQLLQRVRQVALAAYKHQDLPFDVLVQHLGIERNAQHAPLFQTLFLLHSLPAQALRFNANARQEHATKQDDVEYLEIEQGALAYDLTITLENTERELCGFVEYRTDLFGATTIQRLLAQFEILLNGIVTDPDKALYLLPLLPDTERQQLVKWSHAAQPAFPPACVQALFEKQAAHTPHAPAVIDGTRQLTYAELNRQANRLARGLRKAGVGPETRVGVFLPRSVEMLVAVLGVLKAGGAYVPLDPRYPAGRLAAMLADATPGGEAIHLVLTQHALRTRLPDDPSLALLLLDEQQAAIEKEAGDNLPLAVGPANLAYVMYTSGSSGRPKGVMVQQGSLANLAQALSEKYQLQRGERVLQFASLSFDTSAEEIYPCLISGATLVLRTEEMLRSAAAFFECCNAWNLNVLDLPSAYWHALIPQMQAEKLAFPPGVRLLIVGGERVIPDRLQAWFQLAVNATELVNTYGATEATAVTTWGELHRAASGAGEVPVGRPIAGVQTYILDRNYQPTPIGVPGIFYIGGAGVSRGYLGQADLTAERFVPDPFGAVPGARLYCTGDLARYLPDGNIQYLGRQDHQAKIRGFRIETGEIEAALRQESGVHDVVVIARQDAGREPYLAAYLVSTAGPLDRRTLRRALQSRVPEFMLPSAWVQLEALPLTPTGKIDRKALPVPDETGLESETGFIAPRTPVEQLLANIWMQVLHIERVGIYDNFFELGGHSLLATQLISRLRQVFGVDVPLRLVFDTPTLADLALQVEIHQRAAAGVAAPPLVPAPRSGPVASFPLSFSQQRLWFLAQLNPESAAYNIALAVRLVGTLDYRALEGGLTRLIQRHEGLRTRIDLSGEQPVQIVQMGEAQSIPLTDLSDLPGSQRDERLRTLAADDAARPFDLAQGPLLRLHLLRLGEREHVLLLNMHHIISDGWSMDIFIRELGTFYRQAARPSEAPAPLPGLPVQYADFAVWQRQWLQGDVLAAQLAYWKAQLTGAPQVLELPGDHPRPAVQTFRGAYRSRRLPASLAAALQALAQAEGVTLFMTLLAAFQVLLSRYSGQTDIVVGTPIASRNRAEIEGLIGFFVNTLVLRTGLAGVGSFRELLQRVREVALGAYAHQDLPFEMLVEALQPRRSLSHTPIFQVMFILQNAPARGVELPGIHLEPVPVENTTAKFDLTISCSETAAGLEVSANYNADIFEPQTIERLLAHYEVLLSAAVADCGQPIERLPLLTATERQHLLVDFNTPQADTPARAGIHELFEAWAEKTPNAPAVAFEGETLSYAELNRRANRLARHLASLGVAADRLVGICLERSPDFIVSLLGVLKAGGAYVPLDPALPPARLTAMLEAIRPAALITQQALQGAFLAGGCSLVCLDSDGPALDAQGAANLGLATLPEQLAYVLFTSGSTGTPKGIAIEQRQLLAYLAAITPRLSLRPGAHLATVSTFSADLGNTVIFPALCNGGCLHIISAERMVEAAALAEYCRAQPIDCLKIVPSHLAALLEAPGAADLLPRQCLVTGGEALRWELAGTIQRLAPDCRLLNHYGPTETTVGVLTYPVDRDGPRPPAATIPIGRPLDGVQAYLLDRQLNPVPVGVPGELYIGGSTLARGYIGRPDLTAERFLPNPFAAPGERLYRTGDLGRYVPDGHGGLCIEFLGRTDFQVKLRGFRLELGEIEAALRRHPGVSQAVVRMAGQPGAEARLTAYVVANPGAGLPADSLKDFLKASLPEYMLPSAFIFLEKLPLTPNGKLDRSRLPLPEAGLPEAERAYTPPQSEAEKVLAAIWAQVLKRPQVGIHDNFFELGGDSILSIQIVSRANRAGYALTSRHIFQHQTIAELARVMGSLAWPHAEQGPVTGEAPLTPIQHWFFEQDLAQPAHYNQALFLEVNERLDFSRLQAAVNALASHHDALRLRFRRCENGTWQQSFAAPEEAPADVCRYEDLSALPETQQAGRIEAIASSAQASLDLAAGLLMRLVWFDRGENRPGRLLWVCHHLIVDGVSWRILLEDFQAAYIQLGEGATVALSPKTTSYKRWAECLVAKANAPELQEESAVWLSTAHLAVSALPRDFPEAEATNTQATAQEVLVALTAEETTLLLQEVPRAYGTQINDVLLTALGCALTEWVETNTCLIDLEGHGREEIGGDVDLSRTVGWFTAIYPLYLDLSGAENPRRALGLVKKELQRIPNHGIGYGLLRYLGTGAGAEVVGAGAGIARQLQQLPQPEVSFNYFGQLDRALPDDAPFHFAHEASGPVSSERNRRLHLLDVNGAVVNGQLQLAWTYSRHVHRPASIEQLAEAFLTTLRWLIAQRNAPETESEWSPEIFDVDLDATELESILDEIGFSAEES